jgi:hypothetical protein
MWLAELLAWLAADLWPQTAIGYAVGLGLLAWLIYRTDFSTVPGRLSIVVVPALVVAIFVWGWHGRREA